METAWFWSTRIIKINVMEKKNTWVTFLQNKKTFLFQNRSVIFNAGTICSSKDLAFKARWKILSFKNHNAAFQTSETRSMWAVAFRGTINMEGTFSDLKLAFGKSQLASACISEVSETEL